MRTLLVTTVAVCISLTAATTRGTIAFTDFSRTSGLQLNGNAVGNVNNGLDPPVLRLAPAATFQS